MAFAAVFTAHTVIPNTGGKVVAVNLAGNAVGTLLSAQTGVIGTGPVAGLIEYSLGNIFGIVAGTWTQEMVDAVNVEIEDLQVGVAATEEITLVKTLVGGNNLSLSFCNVAAAGDNTGGLRVLLHYLR